MSKSSEAVRKWRRTTKSRMVKAMGGKCAECFYNKCEDSLEFHHLDPLKKDFSLGAARGSPVSWGRLVAELRKCVMLCANCHRELHADLLAVNTDWFSFDEAYATYTRPVLEKTTVCPVCDKQKDDHLVTCSRGCASKLRGKVNWLAIDLLSLLKTKTITQIAAEMGCSCAAVSKRRAKLLSETVNARN